MRVQFAEVHTVPRTTKGIQITDCPQPLTLVVPGSTFGCRFRCRFSNCWSFQLFGDPLCLRDVPGEIQLVPKGVPQPPGSPRRFCPNHFTTTVQFTVLISGRAISLFNHHGSNRFFLELGSDGPPRPGGGDGQGGGLDMGGRG